MKSFANCFAQLFIKLLFATLHNLLLGFTLLEKDLGQVQRKAANHLLETLAHLNLSLHELEPRFKSNAFIFSLRLQPSPAQTSQLSFRNHNGLAEIIAQSLIYRALPSFAISS